MTSRTISRNDLIGLLFGTADVYTVLGEGGCVASIRLSGPNQFAIELHKASWRDSTVHVQVQENIHE